jgi:hypothetical protein
MQCWTCGDFCTEGWQEEAKGDNVDTPTVQDTNSLLLLAGLLRVLLLLLLLIPGMQ